MSRLERFAELMKIMEQAFVHKLRQQNPTISQAEIKESVCQWYLDRPQAPNGDAEGTVGDISRFLDE